MILYMDDSGDLKLTEKALMIKEFRDLRDHMKEQYDVGMVEVVFTYLHMMYDFDSHFLYLYENEAERSKAVRKSIHRGSNLKMTRTVHKAEAMYKTLYDLEAVSMYMVLKRNVFKLKDYASRIVLAPPVLTEEQIKAGKIPEEILVDAKEFELVNSKLPEQLERLEAFEKKLQAFTKDKIDIFGGGDLGEYER